MVWVVQAQSLEQEVPTLELEVLTLEQEVLTLVLEVPTLEQSLVLEVRSFSNAVIALSPTSLLTELLLNM